AAGALAAAGMELPPAETLEGVSDDLEDLLGGSLSERSREALRLGFLAGRMAPRKRVHGLQDPTSFVLDEHLVVRVAEGQSILRLPWIEEGLFVDRQLPDIHEIPTRIR